MNHNNKSITNNTDKLDKDFISLARDWSLWQKELPTALQHITEALSTALQAQRISVWKLTENGEYLDLLDLYSQDQKEHAHEGRLDRSDYPDYFMALGQGRVIDAIDACLDFRTREFCEDYLRPLGIGAMLDATLWVAGETRGVICVEHIGGPRLWNEAETRFIVSVADLVSQLLINDRTRRSEERYTQLLDNMPSVAYRCSYNQEWRTEYISGGIKELSGYTAEEFIENQKSLLNLIHPEDRDRVLETIETAKERRGFFDIEYRVLTHDGEVIWVHEQGHAIYDQDSNTLFLDGILTNITDRRETENQLRTAIARQEAILNGANYSIIYTDVDGTILNINTAAQHILGYTADEMIGKMTPAVIHDQDEVVKRAAELSEELGTVIDPGFEVLVALTRTGKVDEREWTYIHKEGTRIPVLLSVTAIRDNRGEIIGFLGVASDIRERIQSEQAIRNSETRYRTLFQASGDTIFIMRDDTFIDCNEATLHMFGCTRDQIVGEKPHHFSPEYQPDGRPSSEKALEKIEAALSGETQQFEWLHIRSDGSEFYAEVTLTNVELDGIPSLFANVRDISERKQSATKLEQSRKELLQRNENLRLINELSTRLYDSRDVETITEESINILNSIDPPPRIALYLLDQSGQQLQLANASRLDKETILAGTDLPLEGSLSGLALSQEQLMVSSDISTDDRLEPVIKDILIERGIKAAVVIPMIIHNKPIGTINLIFTEFTTFSDVELETLSAVGRTVALAINNARQLDDLEYQAHHDSLTGLPNRTLLHQVFESQVLRNEEPDKRAALMLLDLNRFKEINDTLGHHVGDSLLRLVGVRFNSILGARRGLACRLGGDEFAFLLSSLEDKNEIHAIIDDILDALKQPFIIGDLSLSVDASIGISLYPEDGQDSHDLLRSADVAMYQAKQTRSSYLWYDPRFDSHSMVRLSMMSDLDQAIRNDEIMLHYQPKLDLQNHRVIGFEALVRWQHPRLGMLMPGDFIPLAEMGESIQALSAKVIEQALAQQQKWRINGHHLTVAVNLSARNLQDKRCAEQIQKLMEKYHTRTGELELEITETTLMHDPKGSGKILNLIADLGVTLSVDDFGTGYSSLSYLRKLPIETLKIDRTFVKDMLNNEQDAIIVRSTIDLAHNLKLKVVAEGVEDEATMNMLLKMGCDQIQGYHISRPSAWSIIEKWLSESEYSHPSP